MKLIDRTTWKFLLVGCVNTLVGSGTMFLLYNCFNVDYWLSSVSNYIVGGIVSFFLNKYFTFKNKEKSLKQVLLFILTVAVCYLVAYSAAKPLVRQILSSCSEKVQDNLSMLAGMCFYTGLNYLVQKFVIFKSN